MRLMSTAENPTYSIGELISAQQTVRLHHLSLAVDPLRLYGVQPRALLRQQAAYDPDPAATLFDLAVMQAEPAPDLAAYVPTGVVPDEKQDLLADRFELLAAPPEELGRYGTDGPSVHEAQPRVADLWQVESVAGDSLGVEIVFGERLLDEAHRPSFFGPTAQGGQSQPAPPALLLEARCPL